MIFRFNLGDKAKDKITGFVGVIIGRTNYLTGCDLYLLQPKCKEDNGIRPESEWFDEARLEIVESGVIDKKDVTIEDELPGADKLAPSK